MRFRSRFLVNVLGPVFVEYPDADSAKLSPAKQRTLSAIVASYRSGIDWTTLSDRSESAPGETERRNERAAFRMAISRLRPHLPEGVLEEFDERHRLGLDAAQVDAWRLLELAVAPLDEVDTSELLHVLNPATPFDRIDDLEIVERMRRRIRQAQRTLFTRLAEERPEVLRGELIEHLRDHFEEDPYNETLLSMLIVAEAQAGNRRSALEILNDAKRAFADVGLDLAPAFGDLERDLLDSEASVGPRLVPIVSGQRLSLPPVLANVRSGPHMGHDKALRQLTDLLIQRHGYRSAVVSGPGGAGKTRLCAELAALGADIGIPTVYLAGSRLGPTPALGPLLAALDSFRERMAAIGEQSVDPDIRRAEAWVAAMDALGAKAAQGSLLFIVDDSQQLDSQTAELLSLVPQSELAEALMLVVVTANEPAPRGWPSLATAIDGPDTLDVEIGPLDDAALGQLVAHHRPGWDERLVANVARELRTLSGGMAGIVQVLLANLDELDTIRDTSPPGGDRLIQSMVAELPADVREVGGVAAVIGLDFDLIALEQLSERSPGELLDMLETLIDLGLVRDLPSVRFMFTNVLVQSALLAGIDADRKRFLHQQAAAHFAQDVHRRAHHQAHATPLVAPGEAVASLLQSGDLHLERGAYREAVNDYRYAHLIKGSRLEVDQEGRLARALDLSGLPAEARRVRQRAFAAALGSGDHTLALEVAVSGLPEGEVIDGDAELVACLNKIDPSRLDQASAHDLICHRARQLTIMGRSAEARAAADLARVEARTPDQRVRAALVARFAVSISSCPDDRLALLDEAAQAVPDASPGFRADYCFLRSLDHYEAMDTEEARRWRRFLDDAEIGVPTIRRWHRRLFDAMLHADAGRHHEAQAARAAAAEFGLRAGIIEANNAAVFADFVDRWLCGTHDRLASLLGEDRPMHPAKGPVLARAAAVLVLDVIGRRDEACEHAEVLTRGVLDSPVSQSIGAMAMVTSVLARSEDRELVDEARVMLGTRGDSFLVVGACVASLGPVHRYLAELAPDEATARHHWDRAAAGAIESGSLLWRVVTQRDLAERHDDAEARSQMIELADDGELSRLFSDMG
jgi:hypothetical protein